jgi:hypothetical protein
MAVPRTPASEDSPPTARAAGRATAGPPHHQTAGPFTDQALWARVINLAHCANGIHDPEQWFPMNAEIEKARKEAAAAIAVCTGCPVRVQCLALSLRHWDIGQYGIWGGLVAGERAALRQIARAHIARHAPHLLVAPGADPAVVARATRAANPRAPRGEHVIAITTPQEHGGECLAGEQPRERVAQVSSM